MEETKEKNKKFELWAEVRAAVEKKSAGIPGVVIENLAEKEIQSRVEKTIAVVDALSAAHATLKKIKPDLESFDGEGKLVAATFSKAKHEERKKLQETIERLDAALTEVFENQNFEKLKKLDLGRHDAGSN
jgi:type II secretory pathway component PulC